MQQVNLKMVFNDLGRVTKRPKNKRYFNADSVQLSIIPQKGVVTI